MQHCCSVLDATELPAALHMLGSLRRHASAFHWSLLCLSDPPALALAQLRPADVAIVRLGALERRFPALAAARAGRDTDGCRALLAPFLAAWCLEADPAIARISVLPPTVAFYGDPRAALEALGADAIGVVAARDGSADWLSWPAGERRCVDDHQAAALAGDDVGASALMARWQALGARVAPLAHPGAHAGAARLETDGIAARDGALWCGGAPLLWFRFEHVTVSAQRTYAAALPGGGATAPALRLLYRPYFTALVTEARALAARFAALALGPPPAPAPAAPTTPEWAMQPEGWRDEPEDAGGWSDEGVNQLRLHRLLDVAARLATTAPVDFLAWRYCIIQDFVHAVARAAHGRASVSVLDWGGGLGEYALYLRALWPELTVDYHVREVPAVCDYGRAATPDITFHETNEAAFARRYDVVFAATALQYEFDWQTALVRLVHAAERFVLLTRVPMVVGRPTFVVRQCPQLYGGTTSYQSWVFNQQALLQVLGGAPVTLLRETLVDERIVIPDAPEQPISRGLLLARRS